MRPASGLERLHQSQGHLPWLKYISIDFKAGCDILPALTAFDAYVDPFENCIKHEIKLDCNFTENSGIYADERYICAVGFVKKTNSPCVYLFDASED